MVEPLTKEEFKSEICKILELDENEKWMKVAEQVLQDGRQVLAGHKADFGGRIIREEVESDQGDLLNLLKKYVEQKWYEGTPNWFQDYLRKQREDSSDIYNLVLVRSANHGSRFLKKGLVLSVTCQVIFELTDDIILNTTAFDDILKALLENGRQGLQQRESDLSGRVFREQLKEPKSAIFLALKEHYKQPLENILKSSDVGVTKAKTIEIVLDCITENGWWKGIHDPQVEDEISKNKRAVIEQKLLAYFQAEGLSMPSNIPTASTLQNSAASSASSASTTFSQPMSSQMSSTSSQQSFTAILSPPPSLPSRASSVSSESSMRSHQRDKECEMIERCIDDRQKLSLNDLVMAGELMYTNKTLTAVLNNIIVDYSQRLNFPSFIRACLTPIMYLLKRHQSLDDFTEGLFQQYNDLDESLNMHKLSLRMLIDVLLRNADFSLSRKILILLSKRNPVPFLQPTLNDQSSFRFVADIIHVWDFFMPTILSFGIGPCPGKSTLLNNVLLCSFEQTSSSIYFENTIDIDFGYNFLPRRSSPDKPDEGRAISIADAHGSMTKALLKKIYSLFDGFLIHVTYKYLFDHLSTVLDQLSVIDEPGRYRLLLVRDIPSGSNADELIRQLNDRVLGQDNPVTFTRTKDRDQRAPHPLLLTFFLSDMSNSGDRSIRAQQTKLQNQILDQLPRQSQGDKDSITRMLNRLMDEKNKIHLQKVIDVNKSLTEKLIDTAVDPNRVAQYFPEYRDFVKLCDYHLRSARFNFYGSESDSEVYAVRQNIYDLEVKLKNPSESYSIIFKLFVDILQSFDMITCLELLSTQLKDKQKDLVSTGDLAMKLPIEKSLSLEVLWRNAIVCSHHLPQRTLKSLCQHYSNYIDAGFPFEIVDGDNFYFQQSFLMESLQPYKNDRILVISIIGPQNSGKSTLLNYMFGTLFDVRDGRCTRGIYGSFVKANRKDYDYVMLIDTEGLLSIEREDKEYDRRIVLFCLAVSHVVIVNMSGEISTTLQDMLKLCASSLKELGVKTIPCPIVHFVLNQRADLNIENHRATIRKVIDDLRRDGLNEWIDIREETFHALPSAFKKEGQTLIANPKLGNSVKTASEFIECVQQLTDKILNPEDPSLKRKSDITDPLQWLSSSFTVFDTLRKFPDLTYYQDINERRIDNELREHIRNYLTKTFSSDYRDALLVESMSKDENQIKEIFTVRQSHIDKSAEEEMESLFKLLKVPEPLRKRTQQFMRAQIIQMFEAAKTSTMAANERNRVELLVQNGEGDLKQLIEATILSGKTLTAEEAKKAFKDMYEKTIDLIKKRYVPNERLRQALRHIYTNYNIYEKDFLYEYRQLICFEGFLQDINETKLPINELEDGFIAEFTELGHQEPSVCAVTFNPGGTTIYSFDIIKNLVFLNKDLLNQKFSGFIGCQTPQPQTNDQKKGFMDKVAGFLPIGSSKNKKDERVVPVRPTDQFQAEIREAIKEENAEQSRRSQPRYDDRSNYLPISKLIAEVIKRVSNTMKRSETKGFRQIKTELIQRIVGLVNSLIIEVKTELGPFCLELSRPLKSVLHNCTIILLTKYYYDEQMSHFLETLNELEKKRVDLEKYFISVVVQNSSIDENYALSLLQQLKDYLVENFKKDGQQIINHVLKQYEHINRRWVQDKCDGLLLTTNDIQWNMDYITNPNKIIEKYFKDIWTQIEESINQQLTEKKSNYVEVINKFFFCLEGMLDTSTKFGAVVTFVDHAFLSEINNGLNVNENLVNKMKCMAILFKEYFIKGSITNDITIEKKTYHLRQEVADEFNLLIQGRAPSPALSKVMKDLSGTLEKISIQNFNVFLKRLITDKQKVIGDFNQLKSTFKDIDRLDTYSTLLDKVRGCTELCPCCKRPCDVDHTQIKSNPGAEFNEHSCLTGHSLRAMNGYKFEGTGEASLFMCEQIKDDQEIIIGPTRYQWSQYKKDHSDWKFESALNEDELSKLHGKYLTVWGRIGPTICQQHDMTFVVTNTIQISKPQSYHYILLLDKSGSMGVNQRWIHLMTAVNEFLIKREELKADDRFSIITFSSGAYPVFENEPLAKIDTSRLGSPDGGTSFSEAFKCVKDVIKKFKKDDKSDPIQDNIAILFMTDGESAYPNDELEKLKEKYNSSIKRFWTIALCEDGSQHKNMLEKINLAMNGSFYTVEQGSALSKAYAEIASKS